MAALDEIYKNPVSACAAWGSAGFIAGDLPGAIVGCSAGSAAELLEHIFGPNPYSECIAWGSVGIGGGVAGVTAGRATGVISYYSPDNWALQCAVWMLGNGGVAAAQGQPQGRAAAGGCVSGALSVLGKE